MATASVPAALLATGGKDAAAMLAASPVRPYLLACRRHGRGHVPGELRAPLMALLEGLRGIGGDPGDETVGRARTLAIGFLGIEEAIGRGELNYSNYLNLPLIEAFIVSRDIDLVLARARIAFATILANWLREEELALALADQGTPPFRFVRPQVILRIAGLRELAALAGIATVPLALPTLRHWVPRGSDWIALANDADGLLGLVLLTALPQSRFHDELMFIRITHLAECCFIPAWRALAAAEARSESPERALRLVKEAAAQVALLLKLFAGLFRTLPKENFFDGFRPETGGSSAIQSRNYQVLDQAIRGFGAEKVAALAEHPLVGDVDVDPCAPRRVAESLAGRAAGWSEADRHQLLYHLDQIQRSFLAWRTFHLGIARDYMPAEARGTGGMGIGYLERTLDVPSAAVGAPPRPDDRTAAAARNACAIVAEWQPGGDPAAILAAQRLLANRLRGLGAELSLHDPRRVAGGWWLDTANAGEFFVGAAGAPRRCRDGELVVRDSKGIVAAERGGAALRTAARLDNSAVAGRPLRALVLLHVGEGVAETERVREEIRAALAPLGELTLRPIAAGDPARPAGARSG
jgi:tryptophan 2,3-dioxygenase